MDYYSEANRNADVKFNEPVDYYSESRRDSDGSMYSGGNTALGQSFTGNGEKLSTARFFLRKFGTPTGNAVAKLYEHSGSFGSTGKPTGAALATSDTLDVSTLTSTRGLVTFTFDGTYQLVNGVNYFIVIEYSGSNSSNNVQAGISFGTGNHAGNYAAYNSGTWNALSTSDLIFYINGQETGYGQSFIGDGGAISSAKFYLKKVGAPTGNIYAKIYEHTGTYGTDGKPTGNAVATSDAINVNGLSASQALVEFTFSTQLTTVNGTHYVIVVEYENGDVNNTVAIGVDTSTPTHGGNGSHKNNGNWIADSRDVIFYAME